MGTSSFLGDLLVPKTIDRWRVGVVPYNLWLPVRTRALIISRCSQPLVLPFFIGWPLE